MIKFVVVAIMLGAAMAAVVGIAFISSRETGNEMRTERQEVEPIVSPTPDPNQMSRGNLKEEMMLVVDTPLDSTEVVGVKVKVAGRTVPGADVAVNEVDTKADSRGNFEVMIDVDDGENLIVVVANDDSGRQAEREILLGVADQSEPGI